MRILDKTLTLISLTKACCCLTIPTKQPRPVKKIAIVGAGISGLSMAHCLTNSPLLENAYYGSNCHESKTKFDISIYDARSKLDTRAGSGVQLNGALVVLGLINPKVQEAVLAAGLPLTQVQTRTKAWNGKDLYDNLLQINLVDSIIKKGGDIADNLIDGNKILWTAIMRGALQQVLIDTLPDHVKDISFGKQLVGIQPFDDKHGGCVLEFLDGTTSGPYDLVVGADGIKSACKEYIEKGVISQQASKREGSSAAIYSGIRIKYAVKDGNISDEQAQTSTFTQYFGNGLYCLDGTYGSGASKPNTRSAFLIYLDSDYIGPFRRKSGQGRSSINNVKPVNENTNWTQDDEERLEIERKTIKEAVKAAGVPTIDIESTIDSADRIFSLGVYFHNPISHVGWSKEVGGAHVVLVGDSAHDVYCLATKLYKYNSALVVGLSNERHTTTTTTKDLQVYLKEYQDVRWRATFDIFFKSLILGYLETGGTNGIYGKFRDVFFKTMGMIGVAERILLNAAIPKV